MIAVKTILLIGLLWIPVWVTATAFDISQSLLRNEHNLIHTPEEIIFIDAHLQAYEQLIQPGQAIFVLDPNQDGIQQITNVLTRYPDVKAIHLVSHGLPGQIQLGTTWLHLANLEHYRQALTQWFHTSAPEILIYGCQVAQGAEGLAFIHKLAQLTAAHVAASNDFTGHASKGGNWRLEEQVGALHTPVAFSESVRNRYPELMQALDSSIIIRDADNQVIAHNSGYFEFAHADIGEQAIQTFSIENISSISVILTLKVNNTQFSLDSDKLTSTPNADPMSFQIQMDTNTAGEFIAEAILESDNFTEPYSFTLRGTVGCLSQINVTTTADKGSGSLRDALARVCAGGTITIDNNQVTTPIHLTSDELRIDKDLILTTEQPTPPVTIQRDSGHFRIFYVDSGLEEVILNNLLITQGSAIQGGGLYNQSSFVSLNKVAICRNSAQQGGGIYNANGSISLTNSLVCDNEATDGSGIFNADPSAQLTLDDQTRIEGNKATGLGGGIYNQGHVKITNSLIAANQAASGGGIANSSIINFESSEIIENTAQQQGGGIYNQDEGHITLIDTSVNQNEANQLGGGIANIESARFDIKDGHLSDNIAPDGGGTYNTATTTNIIANTCVVGNSATSVVNMATTAIQADNNWWGTSDGPGGNAPGMGDSISGSIDYSPFQNAPPPHCLSLLPLYGSDPEIGATIDFGTIDPNNPINPDTGEPINPDTGEPISQIITIQEQGNAKLIIEAARITGSHLQSFNFVDASFPIEIVDGGPKYELKMYCIPPEEGEYQAQLTLNTNAPSPNDVVTYELLCHGGPLTEMTSIGYQSQPSFEPPNNLITFPPTQVGQIVSSELVIENQEGSGLLLINSIEINDNTNTFSLTSSKPSLSSPLEIMQGQSKMITLACNPTDDNVSPKEATLIIGTNDPDHPQGVEYILRCQVEQPIYHSTPAPAKALEFGQVPIGESKTISLTLNQEGTIDLEVDLKTSPSSGFQLVSPPSFPITLTETSDTVTLNVHCTPSEPGLYSEQLQLSSTDPNWPTISYPLVCEGIKPGYVSQPTPSEELPWVIGKTVIQETISHSLKIKNQGNVELVISEAILLPSAGPFGIATPLPQVIQSGDESIITVSCTPTEVLLYDETILELVTNDPNLPRPRYRLNCQGTSIPEPSYDSLPAPQQPLTINTFGLLAATTQLAITNNGASDLIIDSLQITADSEQVFALLSPSTSTAISVGESRTVSIQCHPLAPEHSYQAILEVTTNDTAQPKVSYPLMCSAAAIPRLDIGSSPIEASIDKTFSINKIEVAYAELTGADAQAFSLIEPAIPLSTATTSIGIDSLHVQCRPQEGLNAAQFILYNTESKIVSIYKLTCDGITAATPTYRSTPPVETTIDFGETPINVTTEAQLLITGSELTLESYTLTGEQAQDFQVVTPLPLTIQHSQTLELTCTPSATGIRSAELQLKLAHQPIATYALTCQGQPITPPVTATFNSIPEPETLLTLDSTAPTAAITLLPPSQQTTLEVLTSIIEGEQRAAFKIIEGIAPFSLLPEDPAHTLIVECTPKASASSQALLTLTTNDAQQPVVHYHLSCSPLTSAPEEIFAGEIITQAGQRGNYLSIDAPEIFTLRGYIDPPVQHQGQKAKIIARYHWWPADNTTPLSLPVTLATEQLLKESLEFSLFEGRLVHLPGQFQVDLGYQVNGEFLSATIVTLIVSANRPPTDIVLSNAMITEDSAPGTLIGYLTGYDADKGEQLIYGLKDDARGRFYLINNELRVAQGGLLNFEQYHSHDVVVRVVDIAGDYVEKTLTIDVSDRTTQPTHISLTAHQVRENSPIGTVVGKLVSHDREPGYYHYQLLDDANGRFKLAGDKLVVNQEIDFEDHTHHSIKVRSQKIGQAQAVETTFTIKVINVIDLEVSNVAVQSEVSPQRYQNTQPIGVHIQLTPDSEHIDQRVDLIAVAMSNDAQLMMLADQQWVIWNGDLNTLAAVNSFVLKEQHQHILLWQGKRTQLPTQEIQIFVGYRLQNGALIFPSESLALKL